jgi:hypothetical protein
MAHIELATNDTLINLALRISETPVDFGRLKRKGDGKIHESSIAGVYAERHVIYVMDAASSIMKPEELHIGPLPEEIRSENYRLVRSPYPSAEGWLAIDNDGQYVREMDCIGSAGELPFAVEVKTGKSRRGRRIPTSPEDIDAALEPLAELFGSRRLGLIVAGPVGVFTAPTIEQLTEVGGLVAQFPIGRKDFREASLAAHMQPRI